jgi:hypothetical protein
MKRFFKYCIPAIFALQILTMVILRYHM